MIAVGVIVAFALGMTLGAVLMAALAMGARADLEAEVGEYQDRLRRLARDCRCTCGDGA